MQITYLIELLLIDSTNMLYRERSYKFYLCSNLKIYNSCYFKFFIDSQTKKFINGETLNDGDVNPIIYNILCI